MRISYKKIKDLGACQRGLDWYKKHGSQSLLKTLLDVNKVNPSDARWLFTRLMNHEQQIRIAVFSAELVLDISEKRYPDNKAPRKAIEAAKLVLLKDTKETRSAAYAAYAYAYADAYAYAANAAAYAANAAANAAAYAANAADADADAEKLRIQEVIIRRAVKILSKKRRAK